MAGGTRRGICQPFDKASEFNLSDKQETSSVFF